MDGAAGELREGATRGGKSSATDRARAAFALTPSRLFVLLGFLAILGIVAFKVPSLIQERSDIVAQRQAQANTLAQFAATFSARLYDQSSRIARDVAATVRSRDLTPAELQDYLSRRASDTSVDDYIVLLDAAGRVRATSEAGPTPTMTFPIPGFAEHWTAESQEIVPELRSRLTGAVIYPLSQRIDDREGRFAGVVGVNVKPEGIKPVAERKPDQPLLTVWDHSGRFIAASFVDFDAKGSPIRPLPPPGIRTDGAHETGVISATAQVPGWPLVAAASFDEPGMLADWRREVYQTAALIALTVLGVAALVWLGVRTAGQEAEARTALEASNARAAEALAERDLLLQEVDHRVKNSLMMTASLLYLQERRFNDPDVREAFESTRRRLSSIGLVHEALYSGSSRAAVDLNDYLPRLVSDFAEAYGAAAKNIEVTCEVEPIRLSPGQTTPVGLIVAEVMTNAFKYAFEGRDGGVLGLRIRRVLQDVEIEIRDDGRGFRHDADAARGLGARLIESLTEQLRGELTRTNDGGAVFLLRFPISGA